MNDPYPINYCSTLTPEQTEELINKFKETAILSVSDSYIIEDFRLWNNEESDRSTGRTTRLIDYYIQELFNNPNSEIEIIDHTNTQQSNIHLTQMILRRLDNEHRGVKIKVIKQNVLKYVRM